MCDGAPMEHLPPDLRWWWGHRLDERVAFDGGVQVLRLKYTQIELDSEIAKDVRIHPVSLLIGVRIGR